MMKGAKSRIGLSGALFIGVIVGLLFLIPLATFPWTDRLAEEYGMEGHRLRFSIAAVGIAIYIICYLVVTRAKKWQYKMRKRALKSLPLE